MCLRIFKLRLIRDDQRLSHLNVLALDHDRLLTELDLHFHSSTRWFVQEGIAPIK